jgi:hypothetical protein
MGRSSFRLQISPQGSRFSRRSWKVATPPPSSYSRVQLRATYPINITATSVDDPSISATASASLDVQQSGGTLDNTFGTAGVAVVTPFPLGIDGAVTTDHTTDLNHRSRFAINGRVRIMDRWNFCG